MNSQHAYSGSAQPESTPHRDKQINTLSQLLDELNIPHSMTFDSIVNASQRWRRKPGQERWEMPDIKLSQQQQQKVMALLETLGIVDELRPVSQQFEYALLLGATVPRMENRLKQLVKLWKDGVRFNQIIFLVSQRPLTAGIDQVDTLVGKVIGKDAPDQARKQARPLTETEGARLVFETLEMPADMRKVPVTYIDTPRFWQGDHWQRPNTRDTLEEWMKEHTSLAGKPFSGKILVVSDQPHSLYQQEVVRQELPTGFITEVTGQQAEADTRLSIYLDALALWLHNLQKRLSGNHKY